MEKHNKIYFGITAGILTLAVLAGIIWWFFFKSGDPRSLVPNDAKAVAILDVPAMVKDAGIDKDKLMQIDNTTGIDFSKPAYSFITSDGSLAIAAAVDSKDKLENHLSEKQQRSGYTFGTLGSFVICHDEKKLLAMGPLSSIRDNNLLDQMTSMMNGITPTGESQLLLDAESTKSPISCVCMASALPESIRKPLSGFLPKGLDLNSLKFSLSGKLKTNRISFTSSVSSTQTGVTNIFSDFLSSLKPITGSLISSTPEDPAVWVCIGVKGDKFIELLRKNPKIRTMLLGLNMCIDADMMIKATEGDVVLCIPQIHLRTPQWLIENEVSNSRFMSNKKDWNTENLKFTFGMLSPYSMYFTNSQSVLETIGISNPNTRLKMYSQDMQGQKIFATIDSRQVLNSVSPMLMMLGFTMDMYHSMDNLERLNISIGDEKATFDVVLSNPINTIIDQMQ